MSQDILSDLLRTVHLRGALFYYVSGGECWAAQAPPSREIAASVMPESEHVLEYHVVTRGSCWGAIVGHAPVRLEAGDVILFPQGDAHVISSAPDVRGVAHVPGPGPRTEQLPFSLHLDAVEARPGDGGEGCATTLACGFLGCDVRPFNPLVATLPRLLHLRASEERDWIGQFVHLAVRESRNKRPGGEAMLERMSEMMFVDAVRRYVDTLPEGSAGWLAGLRDRFVGRALALMHEDPAAQWTVDDLGRRVGLSRSALHERFAGMIGQPPMQYLASWRMQVAAGLLRNTHSTVAAIAQEVGYESEAAFAKAFKRLVGSPPAAWRREATLRAQALRAKKDERLNPADIPPSART
ncbi:MAG TPA: AraC family transcriptional regulator [Usitatibacter sp.]|nr:AraC family transcriptional regulator [Usitatibacter sp.]